MPRWAEPAGLRERLARLERWLLPGECLLCRGAVAAGDPLVCPLCRSRWAPLALPQCPRCGQPESAGIACRICEGWPPGFAGVRSAAWLDEGARRAVHLLKYEGWWRVADALAEVIWRRVPLPPGATLIPIPLSPAREKSRGYNQSAQLTGALSARTGVPVLAHALERRRDTRTQTALTPEERRANLAGAFRARGAPPARPVLVDDVFTTGATLAEAALALAEAGAASVTAVTFARANRPLSGAAASL